MNLAAQRVLDELREGNQRFVDGRALGARRSPHDRHALLDGQAPKAAVLACSDSRVSPEILFDQGLGDLFVVRTAGHVVDRAALGSLEYAADHLKVPVLIVLGHSRCGAVTAMVRGGGGSDAIDWIVRQIRPSCLAPAASDSEAIDRIAREHVRRTGSELLERSPVLAEGAERGRLALVAGFYDLASGRAELELPAA